MSQLDRIQLEPEKLPEKSVRAVATNEQSKTETVKKVINEIEAAAESTVSTVRDQRAFLKLVLDVHRVLINTPSAGLDAFNINSESPEEIKKIRTAVEKNVQIILEKMGKMLPRKDKNDVIEAVMNETVGLGPLEVLLKDPAVSEIMVNSHDNIYVEQHNQIVLTSVKFLDDEHVKRIILRIVSRIGRRIDENMPMVDARLKDGSRVNAVIPPITLNGPTLTIRKFSAKALTSKDLIRFGTMNTAMEEFLRICVLARLNMVIAGGGSSGKTTLLNVLSSFIPEDERIVTIEDSAELRLPQDHVVVLETRPPNIEGNGAISVRDLVRNSLRMRPDRIIVGECRGAEALDMLQAMNTGHDGSLTTMHSNTPRDAIARLESMVLMTGFELPVKAIRQQISSAFSVIMQISHMQDGSRKVTKITEVCGMEGDTIILKDLFVFVQTGYNEKLNKVIGHFKPTGLNPTFMPKIEGLGFKFPPGMFTETQNESTEQ